MLFDHRYYRLVRPFFWQVALAVYALGAVAAGDWWPLSWQLLAGGVVVIALCSASITVNNLFDSASDRNARSWRNPVATGEVSQAGARNLSILLVAIGLMLAGVLGLTQLALAAAGVVAIVSYSVPPLRLKERPWLDSMLNGLAYGAIVFWFGFTAVGGVPSLEALLLSAVPFLVCASGHILLAIPDIAGDVAARVTTITTTIGRQSALRLSAACCGAYCALVVGLTAVGVLNLAGWATGVVGTGIIAVHWRMLRQQDVRHSFGLLRLSYKLGGVLLLLSALH